MRGDLLPILAECGEDEDEDEARMEESRFEEGVPADPTKNMDPEDAEKWEDMKDKYEDKFKDSSQRVASRSLFKEIVDYRELGRFRSTLGKEDPQAAALLKEIMLHFHKELTLERNTEAALNKLTNMVGRGMTTPEMVRNQVAKIADLLGINSMKVF